MTTNAEYQAAFKAKMREQGLAAVTDWVPKVERETFKAYAKRLREGTADPAPGTADPAPMSFTDRLAADAAKLRPHPEDVLSSVMDKLATGMDLDDFADTVAHHAANALETAHGKDGLVDALETLWHAISYAHDQAIYDQDVDEPWLDGLKARIAKVEAADGPRKYAAFNGCMNDLGQVHVDGEQIGLVWFDRDRWTAYQGHQEIATGHIGSKSKPKAAYLVAQATVEYLTGKG